MKLKSILSLLALAVATTAAAKDYKFETVSGDMTKTRIYTLDNGLKVYLSVNKDKPRIEAHIAVRTGSKNDPAETTGLAHFFHKRMFFKILTVIAPVEVTNRARNVNRALHAAFDGFFDNGFQIILVFAEIRDGVDFVEIKFVVWR